MHQVFIIVLNTVRINITVSQRCNSVVFLCVQLLLFFCGLAPNFPRFFLQRS
jgi:hypothetical protein